MKIKIVLIALTVVLLNSCNTKEEKKPQQKLNGLWLVKKVEMNNQEMTPTARWMQFYQDSTITSGNGWLQHTVGTWRLDANNQLVITNTFGIKDNAAPFKVNFENDKMVWKRKEYGENVEVTLEKSNKLPTSEANKLFGLWKFETIIEDNKDVSTSLNPSNKAMLFLRWDNTYELRNYPEGTRYGMFKTHAHRLQIDMVSYTKIPEFQFYTFNLKNDTLTFSSTNSDKKITLTRIHEFLE